MKTQSIFKHLIFISCLFVFNSVAYADDVSSFSAPICTQPFCKVYTVINPTDNVRIHVSDWGTASPKSPAILFIHGYPHDQFLWLNQINSLYLRNNFRIITMDWRGFGLSDKPTDPASYSEKLLADDINAVLNQLNINKVVLVGHSAGGISMESYVKYYGTSRLRGLVVTNAIVDNSVFAFIPGQVFAVLGAGADPNISPNDFQANNQQFLTMSSATPLEPGLNNFMLIQDLLTPPIVRGAILGSLGSNNLNSFQNLNVKTLIVWGALDNVIQVGEASVLSSIMPNDKLVIFPTAGHSPMLENPLAYNLLLGSFVKGLAP